MINVTNAFRQELANNRRNYNVTAVITLADETVLTLDNSDIIQRGLSMDDAVSDDNSFTALGSCIINSATLVINNRDDSFSQYDFLNAKVVIYLELINEQIKKGTYRVDNATYNGFSITLSLLDFMENFDRDYSGSSLTYPATLDDIVRDACSHCGVDLVTLNFPHKSYVIDELVLDEAVTFRDVLSWATTIAGCFARCNVDGDLELKWFDTTTLSGYTHGLNGGIFDTSTPYATGDNADGGTFNPWNTGDVVDGGNFTDANGIHFIKDIYSQNIAVEDTVITGVKILVDSEYESESIINEYSTGQTGYVISIEGNKFITDDNAQEIVTWLGTQLIGVKFRKLNITHTNNPSIEAGDIAVVFDRKGNEYPILVTRTAFGVGTRQTTVCGAETPSKNTATKYSEVTKNYVESRKYLQKAKTDFEDRQDELEELIANASGLYETDVVESGLTKKYYHNKANLSESDIIMLFSDVGFTVTADGGDNWYGLTVDGVLIASILNTVGINADWINTGELVITKTIGTTTKEIFYANVDTGVVRIVADSFSLSDGKTLDDAEKVAKNYLSADNSGVMVADMTDGTIEMPSEATGRNVLISAESVDIRDGQNIFASFGKNTIIGNEFSDMPYLYLSSNAFIEYMNSQTIGFKVGCAYERHAELDNTETFTIPQGEDYYPNSFDYSAYITQSSIQNLKYELLLTIYYQYDVYTPNYQIRNGISTIVVIPLVNGDEYILNYSVPVFIGWRGSSAIYGSAPIIVTVNPTTTTITISKKDRTAVVNIGWYSVKYRYSVMTNYPAFTFGNRASNTSEGNYSFAIGNGVKATGEYSYAEGNGSEASGDYSHAEGNEGKATGQYAHVEGYNSEATGNDSHAEGTYSKARGARSHAEGLSTVASGIDSHAQNRGTIAASTSQTAIGAYNVEDANDEFAFIIGNGSGNSNRSNALTVDWDGNLTCNNIGDYKSDTMGTTGQTQSVASGTATKCCELSLEAGVWVVTGQVAYQAGGTTGTYRCGYLGTSSSTSAYSGIQVPSIASGNTVVPVSAVISLSATTTIQLTALHAAGTAINVAKAATFIRAVRIK